MSHNSFCQIILDLMARRERYGTVGYARVSSVGQNLEVQLAKLAHCDKIFQEKVSATSSQQPRLKACLEYVREGDTLLVSA